MTKVVVLRRPPPKWETPPIHPANVAPPEKTFDLEGVAKHLSNARHIDTFREIVTGVGMRPYLPVNKQAALAKQIVALALAGDGEISSRFIREWAMSMVMNVKVVERRLNAAERDEIERKDWGTKARRLQEDAARQAHRFLAAALKISDHAKHRPHGVTLLMTSEFRDALEKIERAAVLIRKAGVN
jgi:hypothetical protein